MVLRTNSYPLRDGGIAYLKRKEESGEKLGSIAKL